jgi:hypothetical protein
VSAAIVDTPENMSRRNFLRVGFLGTVALSTLSAAALLTGCSTSPVVSGFRLLRESDLKVLRALLPVVLAGELPEGEAKVAAVEETLHTLDGVLYGTSVAGHKQVGQLFDLLSMPATRYTVVGLSSDWGKASATDIAAFLESWQHSSFQMLRAGYLGLTQMINMSWYLQPRSWAAINYAPPRVVI